MIRFLWMFDDFVDLTHLVSLFDCGQRRLACVLVLRPVFVILSLAARREEIHADPRSPPSIYIHITHIHMHTKTAN